MSFFGVNVTNPFSTPVGQRIEQATDGSLPSENWALNMEICDIINDTEEGPRDAIKAIKKRLSQSAGKNYTIVMYTLTVLETCVKNCGKRFHALACSREFVMELVKLIGPKNEPPTAVQEKILNLVQSWADTFRGLPYTQGVAQVYQELKTKGIEFPMSDLDAMAPIITPKRSVPESESPVPSGDSASAHRQGSQNMPQQVNLPVHPSGGTFSLIQLTEPQMAKLQSELDIVQENMRVLSEMLAYLSTGPMTEKNVDSQPDPADLELLTELHGTCKAMQARVVDLIGKLAHDDLTAELLRINDELNNLFLRYARYTKNKNVPASALLAQAIGGQPPKSEFASGESTSQVEGAEALIDLSEDTATGGESLGKLVDQFLTCVDSRDEGKRDSKGRPARKERDGEKDEFDAFAQARKASNDTGKRGRQGSTEEGAEGGAYRSTLGNDQSLTSSEFERFLAERTAARTETLPNIPVVTAATSSTTASASGTNIQRQIDKDQDKSLFAL